VLRLYVWHVDKNSITRLGFIGGDKWTLESASGKEDISCLKSSIFLSNSLLIMNFVKKGRGIEKTLLIPRDSLPKESLRKLKVIVKAMS